MKFILQVLLLLPPIAAQQITGRIFHDYNSNGIQDVDSSVFYEGAAVNIPVWLYDCNNDAQISTYSTKDGSYLFNVAEGCYYIYFDLETYSIGPYMQPGEETQTATNQVYPGTGKSAEMNVTDGVDVVWNVGVVGKSSVAAIEETSTTSTLVNVDTTNQATDTTTANHLSVFFSHNDGGDGSSTTNVTITDDFTNLTGTADVIESTVTSPTGFDAVTETSSTFNAQDVFGDNFDEESSIVSTPNSIIADNKAEASTPTAEIGEVFNSNISLTASTSMALDETTTTPNEGEASAKNEDTNVVEDSPLTETLVIEDEEEEVGGTTKPTAAPTKSTKHSSENEQSLEEVDESSAEETEDETIVTNKESTPSQPTSSPDLNPPSCIGCVLSLQANVRVQLDNIDEVLDDNSKSLFENVCASFLDEQLSIATPPISNIKCTVKEESIKAHSIARFLRDKRTLSQLYLADVLITGSTFSTQSHQTPESIKFKDLCVGTFTVQGFLFVRALKEMENESKSDETVFQSVENARGIMTYDASEVFTGEQIGDPTNPNSGVLSTKALVAIAAGSVFCVVCILLLIVARARKNRTNRDSVVDKKARKTNKSRKNVKTTIYDEFPELARPSPTSTSGTGRTVSTTNSRLITPVNIRSNAEEIEVDIISDPLSNGHDQMKMPSIFHSRVRRDIVAPAGKLGITVADTAGLVSVAFKLFCG